MKWPNSLTLGRHAESDFNQLRERKEADPTYQEFRAAFEERKENPERARELAERLLDMGSFVLGVGDHDTQLTERGWWQARTTGAAKRRGGAVLPSVVFLSPYDRTYQTHEGLVQGWPELGEVPTVEDHRLREQDHGLALLYNDWRIFHVMHPEQAELYDRMGSYWYRYPQGESVPDMRDRLHSWQNTLTRDYRDEDVWAITHHLTILAERANLERFGAARFIHLDDHEKPLNCGFTTYLGDPDQGKDGKLILDTYNQIYYPPDGPA